MLDNGGNRMYRVLLDHFGQMQIQLHSIHVPERNIQCSFFFQVVILLFELPRKSDDKWKVLS